MINAFHRLRLLALVGALALAASPVSAQEPKSAALAAELGRLLDQMKADSIAAKVPSSKDQYVGALYFPGSQLLVVTARYSVPELLNNKLVEKAYRDIYIDLNSASVPDSKIFVSDLGVNGLRARRESDSPYDTIEIGGKNFSFDGDWRKAKITEDEYMKNYQQAEAEYIKMLEALLTELKKTS